MTPAIASHHAHQRHGQRRVDRQSGDQFRHAAASRNSPTPTATCRSTRSSRTVSRPASCSRSASPPTAASSATIPTAATSTSPKSRWPTFNGTNFLKRIDGGAFEATDGSGQALFGKGGTIVGSSLEGSNTDIADEFTKLIVTQQAYSANTKVITTSNTMVQDLLNVLR